MTITLPAPLAARLETRAYNEHRNANDLAIDILKDSLDDAPDSIGTAIASGRITPASAGSGPIRWPEIIDKEAAADCYKGFMATRRSDAY